MLHLLAIAHAARVPLALDDFTRIGNRVPVLADLRPSGRYLMSELIRIGGIQPLMKTLLDAGLLHGDCLTVTGRTLAAEPAARAAAIRPGRTIVRPLGDPIKPDSHLVVLYGNLAPEGAVAKITGKEGLRFAGRARVFDGEEATLQAILDGIVAAGDVVVIRYEGPRGGPGMREMLSPTARDHGPRSRRQGRARSPTAVSPAAATASSLATSRPEAALGGPLALVRDGDRITIDAVRREINLVVDARGAGRAPAQLDARRSRMRPAACSQSTRNSSAAHRWAQ